MDALEATFRRMTGAGGCDGWQASELKHIQREVIEGFAKLTQRWEKGGKAPASQKTARQVNLTKPGKDKVHAMEGGA